MNTMLRQSIMRNKVCQRALSWSCRSTRSNTEVIRAISSSSRTGKSKTDEGGGGGNLAGRDLGVLGGPPEAVGASVEASHVNRHTGTTPLSNGITTTDGQDSSNGSDECNGSRGGGGNRNSSAAVSSPPSSSWAHKKIVPSGMEKLQKMARQSLLHELWQEQQRTHEFAVDWFLDNMPASYFRQTTEEARLQHLGGISAMLEPCDGSNGDVTNASQHSDLSPTKDVSLHFERFEEDTKEVTFIQPGSRSRENGILTMLDSLPLADGTLQRVHVFPSRDGNLAIHVLGYANPEQGPNGSISPGTEAVPPSTRGARKASKAAAAAGGVQAFRPSFGELFEYTATLQGGEWEGDPAHAPPGPMFEPQALLEYIGRCAPEFVQHSHPRRFCKHRMLYEEVTGTENVAVNVEEYQGSEVEASELHGSHWISIAAANVLPKVALSQALRLLKKGYQLETIRCHLDVIDDPGNGTVTMIRLLVTAGGNWNEPSAWEVVKKDLRRLKWLDERVLELALDRHPGLGLERSEVIVTLANMVYGVLHKQNPWAYSTTQIYQWLDNARYVKHASAVADLFCDRLAPLDMEDNSGDDSGDGGGPRSILLPAESEKRVEEIRAAISRDVEHDEVQGLLISMLDAVLATYRTNFFMPNRWALSLRVDPRILMTPNELKERSAAEIPFGVFFLHGRRFNAFHCRFRDIARGGMRIVTPPTQEQVAIEAGRQFDECYALAFAQQLKNKDIPEGGSKAVLLVNTTNSTGRANHYAVRKSVKACSDALLDLLVGTEETRRYVKDLWGRQELLYLGPDEQVIPQDIDWIIARAAQRKAPFPSAFMSSKPDAGINHKEYGVTSEGVFVFLDEALRDAGIDPKSGQKFTVKLTGGPDGDVGGNMIKILHREFGEACLVVGVADGTGSAEDPDGLSHAELLRLFEEALPIAEFRTDKLGPNGVLHTCDNEEGIRARNTMHNRVKADAFVPAGGRPGTINASNWRSFLDKHGRPSSPLVVEGANLFTTPEARKQLFDEAGVVFVKDSSANKCGVICSSFEIISSMLMTSTEFKENKEAIVSDVLERLRHVGRREAELLFREHRNHPAIPLPRISERISNAINAVTDATLEILDNAAEEEQKEHLKLLLPLFREHLPQELVDLAFDRVPTTLPPQYLRNAMASCLACRVVYTEGINFIDAQPRDRLGELAFEYIREEGAVRNLAGVVEGTFSDRPMTEEEKKKVAQILRSAGVRASLGIY